MRNMGGLRKLMPSTHWTYLIACITIAGFFPLAAFFSKDEILYRAFVNGNTLIPGPLIWLTGIVAAGGTAFYMFRSYFMTFWFREPTAEMREHVHESPTSMTGVLWVLALASITIGAILGWPHHALLERWMEPVTAIARVQFHDKPFGIELGFSLFSILVAAVGTYTAYYFYKDAARAEERKQALPASFLHKLLYRKYYVDELYEATVLRGTIALSRGLAWFDLHVIDFLVDGTARLGVAASFLGGQIDKWIVDGAVNGLAEAIIAGGRQLRRIQTGRINNYATVIAIGAVALIVIAFLGQLGTDEDQAHADCSGADAGFGLGSAGPDRSSAQSRGSAAPGRAVLGHAAGRADDCAPQRRHGAARDPRPPDGAGLGRLADHDAHARADAASGRAAPGPRRVHARWQAPAIFWRAADRVQRQHADGRPAHARDRLYDQRFVARRLFVAALAHGVFPAARHSVSVHGSARQGAPDPVGGGGGGRGADGGGNLPLPALRSQLGGQERQQRPPVHRARGVGAIVQHRVLHGRRRGQRDDGDPDRARVSDRGRRELVGAARALHPGLLYDVSPARDRNDGRVLRARLLPVLRVLGGHAPADVLFDRHLGRAAQGVRGHQVLPVHAGRIGADAVGADRALLQQRAHLPGRWDAGQPHLRHPEDGLCQQLRERAPDPGHELRAAGLGGPLHRVRDQGADVPVPHLAPRRARGSADRDLGHPGRRAAQDGHLRDDAHQLPDPARGHHLGVRGGGGVRGHQHLVWRSVRNGAEGPQEAGRLLVGQPHGLLPARDGRLHRHRHVRRDAADVQPRHHHVDAVHAGGRDLRPRAHAWGRRVRRGGAGDAGVRGLLRVGLHGLAGAARPVGLHQRGAGVPGRLPGVQSDDDSGRHRRHHHRRLPSVGHPAHPAGPVQPALGKRAQGSRYGPARVGDAAAAGGDRARARLLPDAGARHHQDRH